jgi:hypothetical protein
MDLIEVFKIMKGFENVNKDTFFYYGYRVYEGS